MLQMVMVKNKGLIPSRLGLRSYTPSPGWDSLIADEARFKFEQGTVHEEYLMHLYVLFSNYCGKAPIIKHRPPNKITGKISSSIYLASSAMRLSQPGDGV